MEEFNMSIAITLMKFDLIIGETMWSLTDCFTAESKRKKVISPDMRISQTPPLPSNHPFSCRISFGTVFPRGRQQVSLSMPHL
jgi:hypothetical protein